MRCLLFVALVREGRTADADQLMAERMAQIKEDSWSARLNDNDTMVWREMLIAYFAGKYSEDKLFGAIASQNAFQVSGLDKTDLGLRGMQTEAHFYAALRASVTGPEDTRQARFQEQLREVIRMEQYDYDEYRMAKALLNER
jgi:hypothetical protein